MYSHFALVKLRRLCLSKSTKRVPVEDWKSAFLASVSSSCGFWNFTGLFRINRIINIDCCCLVDFILNIWSFSATYWECCSDSCFECIVLHFAGSNWEKGTKSKTLSFSSWSESCPKECGVGSGHDEERYKFIQQSRRKDALVYFLIVPLLALSYNISCIPRGFPRSLPKSITLGFFHLLILISLFFKLLDSYHFAPCFTNPEKKETFFVYLIYCLAASSSASYPRFIFWISAALKISSFFETTRPWAFFAYERRTLCAMHSEIKFCAVCTVKQDWLRMCS